MKLTQPITGNGLLTKGNGKVYNVPCCNWGPIKYPLPSECNTWIRLFENLRDNFSDEEIKELNEKYWLEAQSTASGISEKDLIEMAPEV